MKIRNDFVTNSSSSSFVIAYKNRLETDEETLNEYPFLKAYSTIIECVLTTDSEYGNTEHPKIFHKISEYNDYFVDRYGCNYDQSINEVIGNDKWLRDKYITATKYINGGYSIAVKRVDDWDYDTLNLIRSMEDESNFIVLEDEEY